MKSSQWRRDWVSSSSSKSLPSSRLLMREERILPEDKRGSQQFSIKIFGVIKLPSLYCINFIKFHSLYCLKFIKFHSLHCLNFIKFHFLYCHNLIKFHSLYFYNFIKFQYLYHLNFIKFHSLYWLNFQNFSLCNGSIFKISLSVLPQHNFFVLPQFYKISVLLHFYKIALSVYNHNFKSFSGRWTDFRRDQSSTIFLYLQQFSHNILYGDMTVHLFLILPKNPPLGAAGRAGCIPKNSWPILFR